LRFEVFDPPSKFLKSFTICSPKLRSTVHLYACSAHTCLDETGGLKVCEDYRGVKVQGRTGENQGRNEHKPLRVPYLLSLEPFRYSVVRRRRSVLIAGKEQSKQFKSDAPSQSYSRSCNQLTLKFVESGPDLPHQSIQRFPLSNCGSGVLSVNGPRPSNALNSGRCLGPGALTAMKPTPPSISHGRTLAGGSALSPGTTPRRTKEISGRIAVFEQTRRFTQTSGKAKDDPNGPYSTVHRPSLAAHNGDKETRKPHPFPGTRLRTDSADRPRAEHRLRGRPLL
jgi:hypothetical protein